MFYIFMYIDIVNNYCTIDSFAYYCKIFCMLPPSEKIVETKNVVFPGKNFYHR